MYDLNPKAVTRKVAERINWVALRKACKDLNITELDGLYAATDAGCSGKEGVDGEHMNCSDNGMPSCDSLSEAQLKELHHILFEVHVMDGDLVCPESGRIFLIKEGIPNMLLHEDEVGGECNAEAGVNYNSGTS